MIILKKFEISSLSLVYLKTKKIIEKCFLLIINKYSNNNLSSVQTKLF